MSTKVTLYSFEKCLGQPAVFVRQHKHTPVMVDSNKGGKIVIMSCRQDCPFAELVCRPDAVMSSCPAYASSRHVLREVFKYENFRSGQLEVIIPALHKRDVVAKMATGSGKSLCIFLVPLAASPNSVGVVISPLKGLIDQQVRAIGLAYHSY